MTEANLPATGRWTLRTASTSYTVDVPGHGRWALRTASISCTVEVHGRWPELFSWGPVGVEDGPSLLAGHGRTPFRTPFRIAFRAPAVAAPAGYVPCGLRPYFVGRLDLGAVK